MRIVGLLHSSKAARVLFAIGSLGFLAGCGDGDVAAPGPQAETQADAKAKQDAQRDARQKAYGGATLPPGTKDAAAKLPKQ
jgi:hypothetical protein